MIETIESELQILENSNFPHLIPSHLLSCFKSDLNDRILPNFIGEIDSLLQTVDANHFFKILSFKEATVSADLNMNDSSSNVSDNSFDGKSTFLEISTRLCEILSKYEHELNEYLHLFERHKLLHGTKVQFQERDELLIYQRAIFIQKLSSKHYELFSLMFRRVFDFYQKRNKTRKEADSNEVDDDEEANTSRSQGEVGDTMEVKNDVEDNFLTHPLMQNFHKINQIIFSLELFDNLCGDIVVEVVENKIRQHIENTSMDNYEETFIQSFENWLEKIVIGWIKLIYMSSNQFTANINQATPLMTLSKFEEYLLNYKKQLAHFMYTHYAHVRIKRLFDIVIDFPDSKNAIEDLKICLAKTNLRSHLIKDLKQSIEQRLLHPGVNTSDILTAYVSAIKALMCLDSSGVMMENVCELLKKYLRNRDDTVKCIVSNLTDDADNSNDLMEEFCKDLYSYEGANDFIDSTTAAPISLSNANENSGGSASIGGDGEMPKLKSWQLWTPDPIDALNTGFDSSNLGSKSNIISMLVNIYGSKDMFVNEYKTLLGDRLLSNYSFNMEKEIRNLELLKLRFGDSNLFSCEAMLKDIGESKRINTNILEQLKQKGISKIETFDVAPNSLKCLVLSEQFWPKLKEEKIELPSELKQIQEKFMSCYEAFKGNRTLIWKNNLGQVTLEIEINKQMLEFNVTPVQAAVILKFQEKDTWSLLELSQSLKMCSFALRKKIFFWKMQGLLKESEQSQLPIAKEHEQDPANEIYTLVKENAKLNKSKAFIEEDDDSEKMQKSNEILKEQELTLYWNYTQSMLRGCGCLPLDRIHTWLKMYANPDLTIEQVKYLIDLKTKEQLLKYNAGQYRLNK